MMRQDTIHINDLSIGYRTKNDTKLVASHIQARIYSGELTCLLGANGVGKSTLLRTLSAFQQKLGGEIAVLGRDMDSYSDKELSTTIGVVLTEKCDIRNMSGNWSRWDAVPTPVSGDGWTRRTSRSWKNRSPWYGLRTWPPAWCTPCRTENGRRL